MIERLDEQARLSGAVVHGATVYLAGQIAEDTSADARGQTADILRQIDALLAQAGTDKRHLLTAQIFLADMADFAGMNQAWDAWLDPAHKPAPRNRSGRTRGAVLAGRDYRDRRLARAVPGAADRHARHLIIKDLPCCFALCSSRP